MLVPEAQSPKVQYGFCCQHLYRWSLCQAQVLLGLRPEACVGPGMWKQSTICCPLTFPLASGPGAGVPGATSPKGASHPRPLWGEGNIRRQSCRWAQSLASPQDGHHSLISGDGVIFVHGSRGGGDPDSLLLGGIGVALAFSLQEGILEEGEGGHLEGQIPGGRNPGLCPVTLLLVIFLEELMENSFLTNNTDFG